MECLNTYQRRKNVVRLAETMVGGENVGDAWDRNPDILPCSNGTVELRTGEFREGRQEDRCKVCAPTRWRGLMVKAPQWEKFLKSVLGEDQSLLDYVRRLMGYALLGAVREHVLPILWGTGRNGKGTMLEAIHHVLGEMAGPVHSEMLLDQGGARSSAAPSPDILSLRGRRVVWANETDEGRRMGTARVKWLCGGDTLVGRALYSNHEVRFRPTHTLFLLTNHRPKVDASDYAIWQRIHLIPFTRAFVENPTSPNESKRDLRMLDRLRHEAEGILAWMVRGHLEWREYGLRPPDAIRNAVEDYRQDEDVVGRFVEEWCEEQEGATVKSTALYEAFRRWCHSQGIKPYAHFKFGYDVEKKVGRVRRKDGVYYSGIRIVGEGAGICLNPLIPTRV
jgi:putative DNA primase/helicase